MANVDPVMALYEETLGQEVLDKKNCGIGRGEYHKAMMRPHGELQMPLTIAVQVLFVRLGEGAPRHPL